MRPSKTIGASIETKFTEDEGGAPSAHIQRGLNHPRAKRRLIVPRKLFKQACRARSLLEEALRLEAVPECVQHQLDCRALGVVPQNPHPPHLRQQTSGEEWMEEPARSELAGRQVHSRVVPCCAVRAVLCCVRTFPAVGPRPPAISTPKVSMACLLSAAPSTPSGTLEGTMQQHGTIGL